MSEELLITGASQLVTLGGPARSRIGAEMRRLEIIEDGALVVRDEVIAEIGHSNELESEVSPAARRINAAGAIVLPGFVDAHTHPVFAGTRLDEYEMRLMGAGYQEIAARGGGILSTVRKTRAATEEDLFQLARRHVSWFLEHGTTTIEAKSGYGLTLQDELKILRVIERLGRDTPIQVVPTLLAAHKIPDEFRNNRAGYIDLIVDQIIPATAKHGLARYCDVFCDDGAFTVEESKRILLRAKNAGLGLRIHADQLSLTGGAVLAAELGADSADHLEWIERDTVEKLRGAGVAAILLPGAVFNLGLERYPPARTLIDSGVAVALATDFNPGSSPTPSMQMVMTLACTQMHMTPAEAITASTINPAYTLDLGSRIGSLEVGKQADVTIFSCSDYRQLPYFFGVNHAVVVIKKGRIVIDRRPASPALPL